MVVVIDHVHLIDQAILHSRKPHKKEMQDGSHKYNGWEKNIWNTKYIKWIALSSLPLGDIWDIHNLQEN